MLTRQESKYYKERAAVVPLPYGLGEALSHLSRGTESAKKPRTKKVPLDECDDLRQAIRKGNHGNPAPNPSQPPDSPFGGLPSGEDISSTQRRRSSVAMLNPNRKVRRITKRKQDNLRQLPISGNVVGELAVESQKLFPDGSSDDGSIGRRRRLLDGHPKPKIKRTVLIGLKHELPSNP